MDDHIIPTIYYTQFDPNNKAKISYNSPTILQHHTMHFTKLYSFLKLVYIRQLVTYK